MNRNKGLLIQDLKDAAAALSLLIERLEKDSIEDDIKIKEVTWASQDITDAVARFRHEELPGE